MVAEIALTVVAACNWQPIEPETTDYIRSIGSSGKIAVNVNDVLTTGARITWTWKGTQVVEYRYSARHSPPFTLLSSDSSFTPSASRTGTTSLYTLTIPTIVTADDSASIQAQSTGCSPGTSTSTWTLFVKYCNNTHFSSAAPPDNETLNCGFNCTAGFTCDSPTYVPESFSATCSASAEWDPSEYSCPIACNNSAFSPFAEPVDNTAVSAGQNKTFSCFSCSDSFVRTCEETGKWNDENPSCLSVCSADSIHCGTPINNQTMCGGMQHDFNCIGPSDRPATFNLQCYSNGTWNSADCNCPEVTLPIKQTFRQMAFGRTLYGDCNDTSAAASIALYVTSSVAIVSKAGPSLSSFSAEPQTREGAVIAGHIILPSICLGLVISDAILFVNTGTIAALVFLSITAVCQIIVAVFLLRIPGKLKILFSFCVDITGGLFGWLLVLTANIVLVATDTGSYKLSDGGIAGVVLGSVGGVLLIWSTFLSVMLYEALSVTELPNRSKAGPEDTATADKQRTPLKPDETVTTKTDYFKIYIFGKTISKEMWEVPKKELQPVSDGAPDEAKTIYHEAPDGAKTTKTIYHEIKISEKIIITKVWEEPITVEDLLLARKRKGLDEPQTMKTTVSNRGLDEPQTMKTTVSKGLDEPQTMKTIVSKTKIFWGITVTKMWEVPETEELKPLSAGNRNVAEAAV